MLEPSSLGKSPHLLGQSAMFGLRVNRLVILVTVTFVAIGGPLPWSKFWEDHTGGQGATAAAAEFVQAPAP